MNDDKLTPAPATLPFRPAHTSASPDSKGKRIGILIVAYNALTTLSAVLKRIPAEVWNNIEEIAVFDDHSKDETYELALGYKTLFGEQKLSIFRNEKNLGYGGNQKRGYQYFIDKGFDVVVMLHGDGQYAPEVLAHLYAPLVNGQADAVFGSRMMRDYGGPLKGGMPLYKLVGNKILTGYANRALGMDLSEFHSGYRAYSLAALRHINFSRMTNDFHFDTQIIIKLKHQGYRIQEVPIPTYYGKELCYVNGMRYARNVYRAIRHYRSTLLGRKSYAEFAEFQVHYPLKTSKHSSHYYCRRFAGRGNDVLDVGCGEGFFAAQLAEAGNRVVGVDVLSEPRCASSFEQYVCADLDKGLADALPSLGQRRFDVVLLQDILEHLRRPDQLLRDCARVLKPSGRIVVSVPNVANLTVRLSLLFGRFEYTPRGILDQTHVRFFTHQSARRLLTKSGYEILEGKTTVVPLELALGWSSKNGLLRALKRLAASFTAIFPRLLGYQIMFVARPRKSASVEVEPAVTIPVQEAA